MLRLSHVLLIPLVSQKLSESFFKNRISHAPPSPSALPKSQTQSLSFISFTLFNPFFKSYHPHASFFFREVRATDVRSGEEIMLYHSDMISDQAEPPEMKDRKVRGTPFMLTSLKVGWKLEVGSLSGEPNLQPTMATQEKKNKSEKLCTAQMLV